MSQMRASIVMRSLNLLTIVVFAFALPGTCCADSPCVDSAGEMAALVVHRAEFGQVVLNSGEVRTITQLHPANGEAVLVQWNYGAAGRIECAYVAYRQNGEWYKYFAVDSGWGFVQVEDIDHDGVDELLVMFHQQWGVNCSASMADIPHQLRITHVDTKAGVLVNVTRSYGPFLRTFLFDLRKKYNSAGAAKLFTPVADCEEQWIGLLKKTYESAWFVLLVASGGIAVVAFAMGLSRSPSWRLFSKFIGAATFFATTAAAVYSLGDTSWHVMAFSDFWSAVQVITGYRFNPIVVELLSTVLSAYAGWVLLTS